MATILVIDDDPTTLGLLRTRLEKAGYKVLEALDGQQGLLTAEKERPDLIFLDVRMPKVDGWQVCRTLKSNPVTSQCPVILLTGCSQDAQELYGLQCGADEYITKPWDARRLLDTISKLLAKSLASRDVKSAASMERTKQFVQRMVRMAGGLPKAPNVEAMAAQLLQLATALMVNYQVAVKNGSSPDFRAKIDGIEKQTEELVYWLGLLRDSKASDDPDIPMLLAEGLVLKDLFASAAKTSR